MDWESLVWICIVRWGSCIWTQTRNSFEDLGFVPSMKLLSYLSLSGLAIYLFLCGWTRAIFQNLTRQSAYPLLAIQCKKYLWACPIDAGLHIAEVSSLWEFNRGFKPTIQFAAETNAERREKMGATGFDPKDWGEATTSISTKESISSNPRGRKGNQKWRKKSTIWNFDQLIRKGEGQVPQNFVRMKLEVLTWNLRRLNEREKRIFKATLILSWCKNWDASKKTSQYWTSLWDNWNSKKQCSRWTCPDWAAEWD